MSNLGIGLGRMFETATDKMVETQDIQREEAKEEEARKREEAKEKKALERQEEIDRVNRAATALKMGIEALKVTKDPEMFKTIYGSFYPDSEIPDININEEEEEITINYKGMKLKGDKEAVEQAISLIEKNPQMTPQILSELARLGLAEIEIPEEAKDDKIQTVTLNPDQTVINPKTGKVIYKAPPKADGDTGPKITDLSTYISSVLKKYKITKSGLTMGENGEWKVDIAAFLEGEKSAYQALKEKADQGDQGAINDLKDLEEAYTKMKQILGIGQKTPTPAPVTGVTLGDMMGEAGGEKTKKAVYDPATGRFVYQ